MSRTSYQAITRRGSAVQVSVSGEVDTCPVCNFKATLSPFTVRIDSQPNVPGSKLWMCYQCPNTKCESVFHSEYDCVGAANTSQFNYYVFQKSFPKIFSSQTFSETIMGLSQQFPVIYNQAAEAEAYGLDAISGPGYRKALEFLVKDYCIQSHPDEASQIKAMQLGPVIKKYVADSNILTVAKRATWLGNDETHYERRWTAKDISDFKNLIRLTVHFIEAVKTAEMYEEEMPESGPVPAPAG